MAINVIQPEHGALAVSVSDGVATIAATPDAGYRLDWVKAESGGELLEVVDMAFEVPEEGDVDVSGAFAAEDVPAPAAGQHFIDAAYSNGEVRFEVGGSAVVAAYAGDVVDIIASPFVGYELGAITGAEVSGMRFTMPDADVALSIQFVQTDFAVACGEFVQADVSAAHAGDTVTAVPTGLDDGQVFLGFIVECPELGVCAWALDVVIEFEMPPYDVTVRQMTEAEAAEYAQAIEDEGETGSGDEQERDDSDVDDEEERDTGTLPHDTVPDPSVTPFTPEDAEQGIPGETQPDAVPAVPDIHEDVPTKTITTYIDEIISDFSAASLAAYEAAGAVAIAVYEDGTEAQVPWSSVEDPAQEGAEAVNEAWAVANATNQHFWHRATAPEGDTAGTGAFVTDEAQEDFLAAIAAGAEPTTARPLHNLLMNSKGILLRAAKRINAAFTRGAVAFYDGLWDGEGDGGSHIVARFGSDGFQAGETSKSHLVGDYHSLQLVDKEGSTYFHVSDLRGSDGMATLTETFAGDGSTTAFTVSASVAQEVSATDSSHTGNTATRNSTRYTFVTAPDDGAVVTIVYKSDSRYLKAYTLGRRGTGNVGAYSVAEGYYTTASGIESHAEGHMTIASGSYSHAEGISTTASGIGSHAEVSFTTASGHYSHAEGSGTTASGSYSHAEGDDTTARGNSSHAEGSYTTASGYSSHAEGSYTTASGHYSHAQNQWTKATGNSQTALGKYNASDATSAVIVGNGTSDSARSNAATLDWSGNLWLAGTLNVDAVPALPASKVTSGTFDAARIPALPASKITSGTFDTARIPSLDASKIGSGTLDAARIPNLNTSKITAGTLGVARGGTGASTLASGSYLVGNGTNAVSLKTPAQVLSDIGAAAASDLGDYLPLSGGTLTGALNGTNGQFSGWVQAAGTLGFGNGAAGTQYVLSAKTPNRNGRILFVGGGKKADGDSYGTVVGLGAGGLTIVGGGEYTESRYNVGDLNDTAEYLYLGSDNDVYIETNGNTIANRKTFRFASGGFFLMPAGGTIEADKRIDLGDRSVSGIDYHARLETSQTGALHLIASSGGFSSSNLARGDFVLLSDGRLGVHKHDGTDWVSGWVYYDFTSAATLRSSLGLGEVKNANFSTAKSVASATTTSLGTITLAAGTWLILGHVHFVANANGVREASINTSVAIGASGSRLSAMSMNATGNAQGFTVQTVETLTASTTYNLNVYQNSGSALNTTGYIRAVRLA